MGAERYPRRLLVASSGGSSSSGSTSGGGSSGSGAGSSSGASSGSGSSGAGSDDAGTGGPSNNDAGGGLPPHDAGGTVDATPPPAATPGSCANPNCGTDTTECGCQATNSAGQTVLLGCQAGGQCVCLVDNQPVGQPFPEDNACSDAVSTRLQFQTNCGASEAAALLAGGPRAHAHCAEGCLGAPPPGEEGPLAGGGGSVVRLCSGGGVDAPPPASTLASSDEDVQQPRAGHPLTPVPHTVPSGQHTSVASQ